MIITINFDSAFRRGAKAPYNTCQIYDRYIRRCVIVSDNYFSTLIAPPILLQPLFPILPLSRVSYFPFYISLFLLSFL